MNNKTLTAIIVDDEINARENLHYLITNFCKDITIVGEAKNVDEAITIIDKEKPQLVFLDIEMPKKNGFELVNNYNDLDFNIIFVTAYDNYAIKAFEVSAVDYLLKPIDIERLKQAVEKVQTQELQAQFATRYNNLKANLDTQEIKHISIPYKSDYAIVKIEDILYIQANRMYTNICVLNTESKQIQNYVYAKKLSYFEELFQNNTQFIRTHRSWIVNTKHINSYSKKEQAVILSPHIEIPVSKSGKTELEKQLGF